MRLYSCYHFQWNHISALINIYIYALNAARSTRKIVSVWKTTKNWIQMNQKVNLPYRLSKVLRPKENKSYFFFAIKTLT